MARSWEFEPKTRTLNNRCADRSQLLHDHRVPLLPARREPGPGHSLNVSDLIGAWHRPSRYRCIRRTRRHSLAAVHNARSGLVLPPGQAAYNDKGRVRPPRLCKRGIGTCLLYTSDAADEEDSVD